MEIRVANSLTEEEWQRLFGWGEDIFQSEHLNLRWRGKDFHILVDVDGRAVAHVGMLQHTVSVGSRPVQVCGIGGVVTTPEAQGRGCASRAMRYAEDFMRGGWAVDFGLLFCRDQLVPFYERLGWQLVEEPVKIEQPSGTITSPLFVMVLPCKAKRWPKGRVKLNSFPW